MAGSEEWLGLSTAISKHRHIEAWDRRSECGRVKECYECLERITWGPVLRQVFVITSSRGQRLEARFICQNES